MKRPIFVTVKIDCRARFGALCFTEELVVYAHQTAFGQRRQRPAHRDPRNPELLTQRLLGGQNVAGRNDAAVDLIVQHQKELPVQ